MTNNYADLIQDKKRKRRAQSPMIERIQNNGRPAGLTRTKKIIKTGKDLEIQFSKLCSQIKLDDFKQERSDFQRNERIKKRKIKK